jgi:hypothetical protein
MTAFSAASVLHSPDLAKAYEEARGDLVNAGLDVGVLDRQLLWWNFHRLFERFPSLAELCWEDESMDTETSIQVWKETVFTAFASVMEHEPATRALAQEFKGWAATDPDFFYELLERPAVTRASLMTDWLEWAFDGNMPAYLVSQRLDKDLPFSSKANRPRM